MSFHAVQNQQRVGAVSIIQPESKIRATITVSVMTTMRALPAGTAHVDPMQNPVLSTGIPPPNHQGLEFPSQGSSKPTLLTPLCRGSPATSPSTVVFSLFFLLLQVPQKWQNNQPIDCGYYCTNVLWKKNQGRRVSAIPNFFPAIFGVV